MKNLKNHLILILMAVSTLSFTSCENGVFGIRGDGPIVEQELTFEELQGIRMNISGNVHLTQADDQKIIVKAQQNIIDNFKTEENNGIVEFDFDRNVKKHDGINIYMSIKTLTQAKLSGSGDINTTNKFTSDETLKLDLSGSGNFDIEAEALEIYSNISGSGNFTITSTTAYFQGNISGSGKYLMAGKATEADYSISGSGEISAFNLDTEQTTINISGSGDSRVTVSDNLNVNINGSGDVYYKGNPQINSDISGSGNIKNANK